MKRTEGFNTIRDVAREAGVGVATVSRVLNGSAHVSPATGDRVLAAIRRLGFRPHAQARRILRRRKEMVCFLLSNRDFLHSFHARILQGVETHARSTKQHVVFGAVHYSEGTLPERIPLPPILEERGWVDGLILAGTVYPNFLSRIQKMQIPFVVLGNNVVGLDAQRNFDQVSFDAYKGEFEAVRYVIEQGHRAIAFVGDTFYPWFLVRYKAYLAAMRASRLSPSSLTAHELQQPENFMKYGESAAARLAGSRRGLPTAVICGNDEIAYGLWRSFRRMGVRVPDDVSLVGFDDREEASLMDPPLTTVRVHREELGQACLKALLERLHRPGMPFTEQILATELVVRESVKRLPAAGRSSPATAAVPELGPATPQIT